MSDFDYDIFGDGTPEEPEKVEKVVPEKPQKTAPKKVSVTPKKATVKASKPKEEPSDSAYNIFDEAPEASETENTPVSEKAKDQNDSSEYDVFSDKASSSSEETYYNTSDGGYQDEGGSGNRRNRAIDTGEAAGLAVAAVAGAAIAKSNKVPKAIKNAINPNYQNEKRKAEEQQMINMRQARQEKFEQKAKAFANSQKKPIYKRWWFWVLLGFLLLAIMVGSCGDDESSTTVTEGTSITEATTVAEATTATTLKTFSFDELEVKEDKTDGNWYAYAGNEKALSYSGFAKNSYGLWYVTNGKVDFSKTGSEYFQGKEYDIKNGQAVERTTTTKPTTSLSQRNALNKAKDYLDYTAFSRTGLIKQLEFEGFSNADATWATDNCGADWNEQAYKKAKEYLDFTSFSHSGLIDQLEYEGFTSEQAEYGVNKVGL